MNPPKVSEFGYINFLVAAQRAFTCTPLFVLLDSWYVSLDNLKIISRTLEWHWLARLKSNRLANPDHKGNVPISSIEIPTQGRVVHLKGYEFVKIFKTVSSEGDVEYYATNRLEMSYLARDGV